MGLTAPALAASAVREEIPIVPPVLAPSGSSYGYAVAISGSTAVVAAPSEDLGAGHPHGAVYVFIRDGSSWSLQQKLTPDVPAAAPDAAYLEFGRAVAISGNTLIVGSPSSAIRPQSDNGLAFIFKRKGSTWEQQAMLGADPYDGPNSFGVSVAISGDTAIVGDPTGPTLNPVATASVAYVFLRYAEDKWSRQTKLVSGDVPTTCIDYELFGQSVAISGDTAVVGAPPQYCPGAAYVFFRTGTTWSPPAKLEGDVEMAQDLFGDPTTVRNGFGTSVAISGTHVVVGANGLDPAYAPRTGAAYVFVGGGASWFRQSKLVASDAPFAQDAFGQSVGISGATLVVGASFSERAYLFRRQGIEWTQQEILQPATGHSYFGASVGNSGTTVIAAGGAAPYIYQEPDTDGDGLPDEWERSGITVGDDGEVVGYGQLGPDQGTFIDLPQMGADPLHKDLFVHVDWMKDDPAAPNATFAPSAQVLKMVTDAFATAPVKNPDLRPGVNLHIDAGWDSIMKPGKTWKTLSRADVVPFSASTGFAFSTDVDWTEVDDIKALHFKPARRSNVFRYALICNSIAITGRPGVARDTPSTDFLLAFGHPRFVTAFDDAKAATFMHELGHTLGLLHGGIDSVNDKPNYLSVMNYAFSFVGLPHYNTKHTTLDYSSHALPSLDETHLIEAAGIGAPPLTVTTFSPFTRDDVPAGTNKCLGRTNSDVYNLRFLPGPALDWDCSGAVNAEPVVDADVNGDSICVVPAPGGALVTEPVAGDSVKNGMIVAGVDRKCHTRAVTPDKQKNPVDLYAPPVLVGFDDWSALSFSGDGKLGSRFAEFRDPMQTPVDEETVDEIRDRVPAARLEEAELAPVDVVTLSVPAGGSNPVTFDGSASTSPVGAIAGWTWDFGDGTNGTGAIVTHTYGAPGEYTATLTVVDQDGRVNLTPLRYLVVITDVPAPPPDAAPDSAGDSSGSVDAGVDASVDPVIDAGRDALDAAASADAGPSSDAAPAVDAGTAYDAATGSDVRSADAQARDGAPSPAVDPQNLDLTFNATVSDFGGGSIDKVVVQPDGKVIVGGNFKAFAGCARRNIARANADGSCDTTFDPGLVLTDLLQNMSGGDIAEGTHRVDLDVRALALQPDGKILVGVDGSLGHVGGVLTYGKMIVRLNSDGTLDGSFDATGLQIGPQVGNVYAIVVQPDGRILVGGGFTYQNHGAGVYSLARLNADGSVDSSFLLTDGPGNVEPPEPGSIHAIALQPDGKIVIGGYFVRVAFTMIDNFARLNPDGSLDATFNAKTSSGRAASGIGRGADFEGLAVQTDGKIMLGGSLGENTLAPGVATAGALVRVSPDGSRDTTFSAPFLFNQGTGFALQPDGKVVVVGTFTFTTPTERHGVARVNGDGSLDMAFGTRGIEATGPLDVALQANGKMIVGGTYDNFDGAPAQGLLRLDTDGRRDQAFESNGAGADARVYALVQQPDGKILAAINPYATASTPATKLNSATRGGIGRLEADGTTDPTFSSPFDPNSTVIDVALEPDGKIVVGGSLRLIGSVDTRELARLNADGQLDPSFVPPSDGVDFGNFAIQPDGKILVYQRRSYAGSVVRLNLDGTRDGSYLVQFGDNQGVDRLLLQPDGRLIAAGIFTGVGDRAARIGRFNLDGSLDTTFDPGAGPDNFVRAIVLEPDGQVVIGGWFLNVDGTPRAGLARLNANGSLDSSFVPVNADTDRFGNPRHVAALALQSNGRIVVGNEVASDILLPPNRVFRLDDRGNLDPSFALGTGIEGANVNALLLQGDDRVVVGGQFAVVNGVARLGLARLVERTSVPLPDAAVAPEITDGGARDVSQPSDAVSESAARTDGGRDAGAAESAAPVPANGSGCSCSTGGGERPTGREGAWFGIGIALAAALRRRRRTKLR